MSKVDYYSKLVEKLKAEYHNFITDMKKQSVDDIVLAAHEIDWKGVILEYCEVEELRLADSQYTALLLADNTLNAIYQKWFSNSYLANYDDVATALSETAEELAVQYLQQAIDSKVSQ